MQVPDLDASGKRRHGASATLRLLAALADAVLAAPMRRHMARKAALHAFMGLTSA